MKRLVLAGLFALATHLAFAGGAHAVQRDHWPVLCNVSAYEMRVAYEYYTPPSLFEGAIAERAGWFPIMPNTCSKITSFDYDGFLAFVILKKKPGGNEQAMYSVSGPTNRITTICAHPKNPFSARAGSPSAGTCPDGQVRYRTSLGMRGGNGVIKVNLD
jgi:hypothetical protein